MMPSQNKSYLLVTTAVAIVILCCFSLSYSLETYEARCQSALTSDGKTVDTCDSTKFLKCHDGRCRCADQTNQIWTYKLVKASSSRSRRSPKKGGSKGSGKKIAAGVAAGAVGGYVASNIAHNIGNSGSNRGSSGSGSSSRDKYEKVYSCYSRVQGTCILEGKQNGISIIQTITAATTTSSTTAAPVTTVSTNSTTENKTVETTTATSSQPQALAQVQYITEYISLPKCVEHAVCTVPEVKIVNGTVVSGASSTDARIGECSCQPGFKANNLDLCVKSGAGLPRAEISFAVLVFILISKLY